MEEIEVLVKISPKQENNWFGGEIKKKIYYNTNDELSAEIKKLYAILRAEITYQKEIGRK